jgi:hypothetical protein
MKILACTDEDTLPDVAAAMVKLRPQWDVRSVRDLYGLGTTDPVLLDLLQADERALISRDRSTLLAWLKARQAQGKDHSGVFFWDPERFHAKAAVGALAKAAVATIEGVGGPLKNVIRTIR